MRSLFGSLVVLVALVAGGCAGEIGEMPTWVGFQEDNVEGADDVAVAVLKVTPPSQVLLAAGRIGPNGWRSKGPKSEVWLSARDGFVVAKVSPTQDELAYAVLQVRPSQLAGTGEGTALSQETGFWSAVPGSAEIGGATHGTEKAADGPAYGPAGEARIPAFTAIARRVTFVGTIKIDALAAPDGDQAPQKVGITPVFPAEDIEAVRGFLAQRYPKIGARVVPGPLQMVRRNAAAE
jgi:hypothetical protein